MEILREPLASEYRTHDLRRGHAKDLQLSGVHYNSVIFFQHAVNMWQGHPCTRSYKLVNGDQQLVSTMWMQTSLMRRRCFGLRYRLSWMQTRRRNPEWQWVEGSRGCIGRVGERRPKPPPQAPHGITPGARHTVFLYGFGL